MMRAKDSCRVPGWQHLRQSYQMPSGGWRSVWHFATPQLRELADALAADGDIDEAAEVRAFAEQRQVARDARVARALEVVARTRVP